MRRIPAVLVGLLALTVLVLLVGTVWFAVSTPLDRVPSDARPSSIVELTVPVSLLGLAVMGALCALRLPRNAVGWVLLSSAVLGAGVGFARFYSQHAIFSGGPVSPSTVWLAWVADWLWVPWLSLQVVALPLLFPAGSMPRAPWKWVGLTGAGATVVAAAAVGLDSGLLSPTGLASPVSLPFAARVWPVALGVVAICAAASIGSLFLRLHRARAELRLQMRWLVAGVTLLLIALVGGIALHALLGPDSLLTPVLFAAGYLAVPVSIAVAVLRFHLYEIDLVISRSLVFGALAVFIAGLYFVVVYGIGRLVGLSGAPWLSLAAAALAAVVFHPVREWVQRGSDRLVFGDRGSPYAVLADLARRGATDPMSDDLLREIARVAALETGALSAEVWIGSEAGLRCAGSWPGTPSPGVRAIDELSADMVLPVLHDGLTIGGISMMFAAGAGRRQVSGQLLTDLAHQTGLLLSNRRLTSQLIEKVEELRESRRRLVDAQDAERRRLERDLHDGAQQHLYSLKLGLRQARTESRKGQARLLEALETEADGALQALRELARGVFPPLLTAQGLPAALSARARSCPIETSVTADGIGRYSAEIEGTMYFCCLEALQNALHHAQSSQVRIHLEQRSGELIFEVRDDGIGLALAADHSGSGLQGMRDRLDVHGGRLEVNSEPGCGTLVTGWVPAVPIGAVP